MLDNPMLSMPSVRVVLYLTPQTVVLKKITKKRKRKAFLNRIAP